MLFTELKCNLGLKSNLAEYNCDPDDDHICDPVYCLPDAYNVCDPEMDSDGGCDPHYDNDNWYD